MTNIQETEGLSNDNILTLVVVIEIKFDFKRITQILNK